MNRLIRASLSLSFAAVVLLGSATNAHANMWDWIKDLSGPGPSNGDASFKVATLCIDLRFETRHAKEVAAKPFWAPPRKVPCVFVDYRGFQNSDDDNFPAHVTTTAYDVGPTWKLLQEAVEVGVGIGVMSWDSQNRVFDNRVQTRRITVSYPRIVVEPFRIIPSKDGNGHWTYSKPAVWQRLIKYHFRDTVIGGSRLSPRSFAAEPGTGPGQSDWPGAKYDHVWSGGFLVDFAELF
jgi:hypothetical protein